MAYTVTSAPHLQMEEPCVAQLTTTAAYCRPHLVVSFFLLVGVGGTVGGGSKVGPGGS